MKKELNNNYKFEEAWQQAFSDKEKVPDSRLWANIEAELPTPPPPIWKRPVFWFVTGLSLLIGLGAFWWFSPEAIPVVKESAGLEIKSDNQDKKPSQSEGSNKTQKLTNTKENKASLSENVSDSMAEDRASNPSEDLSSSSWANVPPQNRANNFFAAQNSDAKPQIVLMNQIPENTSVKKEETEAKEEALTEDLAFKNLSKAETSFIYPKQHLGQLSLSKPERVEAPQVLPQPAKHWWSVSLAAGQVNSGLQNRYQQYLLEYMQAHQHDMFNTGAFFEQSQEQLSRNQSYQMSVEFGKRLGNKFYLQGGLSYHFWQYNRQSNNFYKNSADGSQHDFMAEMLKNKIADPSFIKALQAHDVYQAYLQGNEASDLYLAHFNTENAQAMVQSQYHFLSMPFRLGYQSRVSSRLNLNLEVGAAFNYFIKNTNRSEVLQNLENFNAQNRGSLSQSHLAWSAGAFAEYQLKPRLSSLLGIEYQKALGSITEAGAYTQLQPEFLSLKLGLRYYWR